MAPLSEVWKERGRGRLSRLERAEKEAEGVGRLRRRSAAIVCFPLLADRFNLSNGRGEDAH